MYELEIFNNSAIILNKKVPSKIVSWITILIISFIIIGILSFVDFFQYKSMIGVYHKNFIEVYNYDFPLYNNKELYIEKKIYEYKIVSIEQDKVILSIDLDEDLKIENNILNINILKGKTSLFKLIKSKWKEVFYNEKNE